MKKGERIVRSAVIQTNQNTHNLTTRSHTCTSFFTSINSLYDSQHNTHTCKVDACGGSSTRHSSPPCRGVCTYSMHVYYFILYSLIKFSLLCTRAMKCLCFQLGSQICQYKSLFQSYISELSKKLSSCLFKLSVIPKQPLCYICQMSVNDSF